MIVYSIPADGSHVIENLDDISGDRYIDSSQVDNLIRIFEADKRVHAHRSDKLRLVYGNLRVIKTFH